MLNKTFRYAVSDWVVSTKENKLPHLINQKEIEFLLNRIVNLIENNDEDSSIDWTIQKNKNESPKKITEDTINYLKFVALKEMKMLIFREIKVKLPREFIKDDFYFSKKHNEGF